MGFDGQEIVKEIEAGIAPRNTRMERYNLLRSYYRGDPPQFEPGVKGGEVFHWPVIQPMLDALTANVVNTIASQSPHCVPKCYEDQEAEDMLARILQFFAEKDGVKMALKRVGPVAGWSNVGIIQTHWDDEKSAFEFEVIPPQAFVCYPSWVTGIGDAKFCGHRFLRRRDEVEALMKEGVYRKVDLHSSFPESIDGLTASRTEEGEPVNRGDESIELWRLLYKRGDKLYQLIVAQESRQVLREEEWTYDRHNYSVFFFKPYDITDGFWPAGSVANDMQDLQRLASATATDTANAFRMGMFGTGFTPGEMDTTLSSIRLEPGAMITGVPEGTQYQFHPTNPSFSLPWLQYIMEKANDAARISDMARGIQQGGNKTATQAQYEAMGAKQGMDEYLENFGMGVVSVYEFMQAALAKDRKWRKKFGAFLGLDEIEDADKIISTPALWSLAVSSIGATPQMMLGLLQQVIALAADPEFGFDKHKLGELVLSVADRLGMTDAEDIQFPAEPAALAERLADMLAEAGIDPSLVLGAVAQAIDVATAGGVGSIPAEPLSSGVPGGTIPATRVGSPAIRTGDGSTDFDPSGAM